MSDSLPVTGPSEMNKMSFLPSTTLGSGEVIEKKRAISTSDEVREKEEIQAGPPQIDKGGRAFQREREQLDQRQGGVRLKPRVFRFLTGQHCSSP